MGKGNGYGSKGKSDYGSKGKSDNGYRPRSRSWGMEEGQWQAQKAANERAAIEGRCIYIRGVPPEWSTTELEDFLLNSGATEEGKIESANMLPLKQGQAAVAAFVNFHTAEDANNAAQACDNTPVTIGYKRYNIACSIKRAPGQKVAIVSGFSDLSQARQEKRSVYMSGLPIEFNEKQIRELLEEHGAVVEKVNMLPGGTTAETRNLSCFAIVGTSEQAANCIAQLDGTVVSGKRLSVNFPRPPKRTKQQDHYAETIVEIYGFPREATSYEVQEALEVSGIQVHTVKILRHESMKEGEEDYSIALVYLATLQDAEGLVLAMDGLEYGTGWCLKANIRAEEGYSAGPVALENDAAAPALQQRLPYAALQAAPVTPPEEEQELDDGSCDKIVPLTAAAKSAARRSQSAPTPGFRKPFDAFSEPPERPARSTPRPSQAPDLNSRSWTSSAWKPTEWGSSAWQENDEPARKRPRYGEDVWE